MEVNRIHASAEETEAIVAEVIPPVTNFDVIMSRSNDELSAEFDGVLFLEVDASVSTNYDRVMALSLVISKKKLFLTI